MQSPITIQEGAALCAAGVWGEGHALYPGRSAPPAMGENPRQEGLETGFLMFGRNQQRPYEPES